MREILPQSKTVLTMGILSLVTFFLCCGPLNIIFSIIGLVQAKTAKKLYESNPGQYEGIENVNTGRLLSIIGLVLSIIGFILTIVYFGIFLAILRQDGSFNF
ncbi:MAG: CCC motif membrane protein [Flavobacteriaceae bacterium]|nr:CCC motif membrane protein [Flavobacteriaceae bacterium]